MILQGSRNFLTTPRIRPDVCDITESQLLFAAPQCSVIKLRALGFQKRSAGIKTQHSHPEYMQCLNYWHKQETCTSCHIVCHCILDEAGMPGWFRQGCDHHTAVMSQLISPPVSPRPTHVALIFLHVMYNTRRGRRSLYGLFFIVGSFSILNSDPDLIQSLENLLTRFEQTDPFPSACQKHHRVPSPLWDRQYEPVRF